MDFYHFWLYTHLLNTKWFLWTVIWMIFGFNIIGPIIVWYVMNGIQLPFTKGKKKRETNRTPSDPSS